MHFLLVSACLMATDGLVLAHRRYARCCGCSGFPTTHRIVLRVCVFDFAADISYADDAFLHHPFTFDYENVRRHPALLCASLPLTALLSRCYCVLTSILCGFAFLTDLESVHAVDARCGLHTPVHGVAWQPRGYELPNAHATSGSNGSVCSHQLSATACRASSTRT